jgi:uncharacterized damage-inducible protein DinB
MSARFLSYHDLLQDVSDELLDLRLDVPKSKSLKEHLWCVIGARESYTKALAAGSWQGFGCSLEDFSVESLKAALKTSSEAFFETVSDVSDWTEETENLMADLMEHEVMHEGQIIRLLYGLKRTIPKSVKWA